MLCEKCKKNEAVVFYKENINGQKKSVSLCETCAKEAESKGEIGKLYENSFWSDPLGDMNSLFGSLFGFPQYRKNTLPAQEKCNLCGAVFSDIVKAGKVGCPECYKTFEGELSPTITRIHGAAYHTGNAPERFRAGRERKAQIAELETALKNAIASEEYEQAATLRDKLRALREESDNL